MGASGSTSLITVRSETSADIAGIRNVTLAAFPTSLEADLVAALRDDPAWIPGLSWVALTDGTVVAHALLTRNHVDDTPSLTLGPVSVRPDRQRQGRGQHVVRAALNAARGRGEASVIVLGHPEYYPRFGFTTASAHGIAVTFDAPDDALMALSLTGDALPKGTVTYPAPFGI